MQSLSYMHNTRNYTAIHFKEELKSPIYTKKINKNITIIPENLELFQKCLYWNT